MNFIPAKDTPFFDTPIFELHQVQGLLLAIGFMIVIYLATRLMPAKETRRKSHTPGPIPFPRMVTSAPVNMSNPSDQLQAIAKVQFERVRLLNREEAKLLPVLEQAVIDIGAGYRVMAQTSLGEIISPKRNTGTRDEMNKAFASINSKRLDFAIFDRSGMMACAIEYQGSGHHQGTAFMRDAVKKEVLRRAGVPLVEVSPKFDPSEVRATLGRILAPAAAGSQHSHTAVHM